jgi:rubredoxin/uncharacterized membrane protein
MKMQWRCTVCGYIHDGDEPPDLCPVCGVGSEKFVPVEQPKVSLLQDMIETFEPHAVAAHFPNALLPTLVLFVAIAFVFGKSSFETAAFYLLAVVLFAAPATLLTGLRDWKTRFNGQKAVIFKKKIVLGVTLIILSVLTVALRSSQPDIVQDGGGMMYLYFGLLLAMLGCVTLLGHYGGKLVFSLMGKE